MITAAIWGAWFSAFGMFKMNRADWSQNERIILLTMYFAAPVLATIAVNR